MNPDVNAEETIPDVVVFGYDGSRKSLLVDVVVTHPTCPSHRIAASKNTFAAADSAVKTKIRRYASLLAARKKAFKVTDHFSAFAVESYGGLHKTAIEVIKSVTEIAEQRVSLFPSAMLRKSLMDSVAINIQRGNAMIMMSALAHQHNQEQHRGHPRARRPGRLIHSVKG